MSTSSFCVGFLRTIVEIPIGNLQKFEKRYHQGSESSQKENGISHQLNIEYLGIEYQKEIVLKGANYATYQNQIFFYISIA